jgi:hypothetical protein
MAQTGKATAFVLCADAMGELRHAVADQIGARAPRSGS